MVNQNLTFKNNQLEVKKCISVGVSINLALTVVQIMVGMSSGSQALLADGIHSFSDLMVDCVVLFVNQHSNKEADDDHHYGHKRYDTAALLFLGFSLLLVGLGILWKSIDNLVHLNYQPIQPIALYVACVSLVGKELLFRYILSVAKKIKSSLLQATAWHARSDALSSLVVAIGVVGVFIGFPILDALTALLVSLLIIFAGGRFVWTSLNDLMDRSVALEDLQKIQQIIVHTDGVKGYHDLRTRKMGDLILVDVHLEIDGSCTVQIGHDIAFQVRDRIMRELPVMDVMTHVDPV
ncbi:MAG: cation diffusion facilitator family transporter [Gammaproteobacteria bacterium]|nr:cation diffusion facilitator family transporter [Gammaproteobacteria bacterium]